MYVRKDDPSRWVYPVHLEAMNEGGFLATFPDVPEAIASGDTREAAMHEARKALGIALRGALADGEALPPASDGTPRLAVLVADGLKLSVIAAFASAGLSQVELAKRIGRDGKEVRRILDASHHTKPAALEDALAAMGASATMDLHLPERQQDPVPA
ncbi:MAG: type II toxin-antitoxin system HicB family antitoxin [Pseudomonadota bacterium]